MPDYIEVAKKLRNHSIVILRDYNLSKKERLKIGTNLRKVCTQKQHLFLVAEDLILARELNADGVHLPEKIAHHKLAKLGTSRNNILISSSAHSYKNFRRHYGHIDLFLVSQFFASSSHKNTRHIPFYYLLNMLSAFKRAAALGGVNKTTSKRIAKTHTKSFAMISGIYSFICIE